MKESQEKYSSIKFGMTLIFFQLLVAVVVQPLLYFLGEEYFGWSFKISASAAKSALLGGMVYWIPFAVFTLLALCRKKSEQCVGLVLADFIFGFLLKFALFITLFILVLKFTITVHFILFLSFGTLFITQLFF